MVVPCPRCGEVHEGDCPDPAPAAEQAPRAEACPFCGEPHPRTVKCADWAKQVGTRTDAPWGGEGFTSLPPLPSVQFEHREPKPRQRPLEPIILRVVVGVLAVIGAIALVRVVGGRIVGEGGGTAAALPSCTADRIRHNLASAITIQSESSTALTRRIDQNNALLLSFSNDCDQRDYLLFSQYIADQSLCLALPTSGACALRDMARSELVADIGNP